jgi:hypothetical protein
MKSSLLHQNLEYEEEVQHQLIPSHPHHHHRPSQDNLVVVAVAAAAAEESESQPNWKTMAEMDTKVVLDC